MDASIPAGAIPVDQFESAQSAAPASAPTGNVPAGAIPVDQFQTQEEAYSTPGQQAIAGLEGAAQGVAGPLAPMIEKGFGIKEQDILGRQEANPWTHGITEGAALVGSTLAGVGEGALLAKVGEGAKALVGLGEVAGKTASLGFKVGSSAVQQAAEMAVLSGSDDVAKMVLNDPDTSAQSALANAGISAVIGGAGGAFMSGVASPLWQATVGPKAEAFFQAITNRVNGQANAAVTPAVEAAIKDLGIEVMPELKAGMSPSPLARDLANGAIRAEDSGFIGAMNKLHEDVSNKIAESVGTPLGEIAEYSEKDAGTGVRDTFGQELEEKYGPLAERYAKQDAEDALISASDEDREGLRNRMLETGITSAGTDSPYYKEYVNFSQRVLARDTLGELTQLQQEASKRARSIATDYNEKEALNNIAGMINDFKENQVLKAGSELDKSVPGSSRFAEAKVAEMTSLRGDYKEFAKTMNETTNHLGVGDFKGEGTLRAKIANKLSPEDLLRKFSPKGNAEFIPFLEKNFPETAQAVKRNEAQSYLSKAIKFDDGKPVLDYNQLGRTIENAMKKEPERVRWALGQDTLDKIQSARTINNALPNPKNSGTPKGITQLLSGMPTSALAAVGWMMGHNPLVGGLIGMAGEHLGPMAQSSGRTTMLRFLSSEQPVNALGIRSMASFLHHTYQGETVLAKAASNVLKRGAQVLTTSQMPVKADRDKLDKQISQIQKNPDSMSQKNIGADLGSYLPTHQAMLVKNANVVTNYLQSIKPKPHTFGPLDRPVDPQPSEVARYNRALDIAIQPAIVLHHVKEGTLLPSDIQDLHNMYPGLYQSMASKLTNSMAGTHSDEEAIPYTTRVGMGMFLGQALDSSMSPASIVAAQPQPKGPPQAQGGGKTKKSTSNLGKSNKSYQTQSQAAESDRGDRT